MVENIYLDNGRILRIRNSEFGIRNSEFGIRNSEGEGGQGAGGRSNRTFAEQDAARSGLTIFWACAKIAPI